MTPELEATKKIVQETLEIVHKEKVEADKEKEIVAKDEAEAKA